MISRKSAHAIAHAYANEFSRTRTVRIRSNRRRETYVSRDALYDFLYQHDFSAWFCNGVEKLFSLRDVQEFIMRLHTGETQMVVTPTWDMSSREKLGQKYLLHLAEAILKRWELARGYRQEEVEHKRHGLLRSLELDGYVYHDDRLLFSEADILDVQEERGLLQDLYERLELPDPDIVWNHLDLSEEHYVAERWGDCISNARSFLECTLKNVASAHSRDIRLQALPNSTADKPAQVRHYLCDEGMLEPVERDAIAKAYAMMSQTGSHPYMAEKDQARLVRHIALTYAQFAMLRYEGAIASYE